MGSIITLAVAVLIAIISANNKKKKQAQGQPYKPVESPWDDILDNWDIKPRVPAETHVPQAYVPQTDGSQTRVPQAHAAQTYASQTAVPQARQTLHPASLETIENEGYSLENEWYSLETADTRQYESSPVRKIEQKQKAQHKMTSSAIREEEITAKSSMRDAIFEGGFDPRMGIIYAEIMNPKYKEF